MSENSKPPDPDLIEQALAAFREMPVPERPPDQDLLARLAALPEAGAPPAPLPQSPKRRFLMRSTFAVVGAAAAVPLAVGAWLLFSGGPAVALGDVIRATEKHQIVKYKVSTEGEPAATVYAELTGQRSRHESRTRSADGKVETLRVSIMDGAQLRGLLLTTETEVATGKTIQKEARVTQLQRGEPKPFHGIKLEGGLLDFLREVQAHKETRSEKVQLDGRDVVKYRLEDGDHIVSLWVDSKTRLPVRQAFTMPEPDESEPRQWVCTEYEWDPKGANADRLFSTDPPEGYTIRDAANGPERKGRDDR